MILALLFLASADPCIAHADGSTTCNWAAASCKVQATPFPLEVVRQRLAMRNPPAGLWSIALTCQPGTRVTRESIIMAITSECRTQRLPIPLFLPKEAVAPTLFRGRGGRLQLLKRIAMYAGSGAAIAGVPWLALAGPIADQIGRAAEARVPDLADLSMEIPAVLEIPASGGITIGAWSAKMRKSPDVIGPFALETQ